MRHRCVTTPRLKAQQAQVRQLESAWKRAVRAAQHPGEAPRTSPIALGAVTAADMTGEDRQLIGGLALVAGLGRGESAPAQPDPAATLRDQSRFRVLGPGVTVPPRMS